MTYNQLVNTSGAFANQSNIVDSANDLPILKGSLDAKIIRDINKYFKKYKKIEAKTGVPWKAVAAIDQASGFSPNAVAKKVQKLAKPLNMQLNPNSDARDIMDFVDVLKKQYPKYSQMMEAFLSHYQSIDAAYK